MIKRLFSRLDYHGRQALILTGVNSLFWFSWAFSSYQTIYLQGIGFSASQLGVMNALTSAFSIASVAFWGMVSDRMGSLRKVLITVLVGGSLLFALIPQIPTNLPFSTLLLFLLLPLVYFFRGSMSVYAENILVRNSNELHLNFGLLRSVGSFLYTVGSIIASVSLSFVGVPNTFWLTGLLTVPVIVLTFFARDPSAAPAVKEKKQKLHLGELFHNKAYVSFLIFGFLFYIAVNCEGSFLPYFISDAGIPSERYGIVLAYRALFEIPFLLLMVRLRRKFPLRILVIASAVLMATECLGLGLWADSLPSMLLCCTFFGLGNGLCIGSSLNYVYELAPPHLKASAQAFFSAVSSIAGILGNLGGGVVYDAVGSKAFYLLVALIYFVSVGVFLLSFLGGNKKGKPLAQAS